MNEIETLLKQISLGEDSLFEFKNIEFNNNSIIGPSRNSFASEITAMANAHGGTIILGVDDKTHTISGIPLEKLDLTEEWLRNIANDSIKPPVECRIRKLSILIDQKEKYIIRIDIPKSIFVHESPEGYFYRIGSSKRKMTPDFLARLFQQKSQTRIIRFDEQLVMNASVNDLVENKYNIYKTDLSPKDNLEFLRKLKLISENEDGVLYPTVSGILISSNSPEYFISNAYIQAVCYLGDNYGSEQLDAMDITGSIDIQIKEACKFVKRNMKIRAIKDPGRIETPQYSLNAVFEAIVNAVAHRDYSIYGSKIRLHIFSNRIEIYSPGNIPNTMTIDCLPLRQSSRNELLNSLLSRCPINIELYGTKRNFIMDKRGEGVPIIISESNELSGKIPEYKLLDDTELLLTIYSAF